MGALGFVLAVVLVIFSRREASTLFLAVFVAGALVWTVVVALDAFELSSYGLSLFMLLFGVPWYACGIAFGLTYPDVAVTRTRKRLLVSLFTFVGLVMLAIVVWPSLFLSTQGFTSLGLAVQDVAFAGTYALVLLLLGYRWLSRSGAAHRSQVLWGLIPFLYMGLHDGLGFVVLPTFVGPRYGVSWWLEDPLLLFGTAIWLMVVLGVFGLFGWAVHRLLRGQADSGVRTLALLAPFLVAASLVQVVDLHRDGFPLVHLLMDGLFEVLLIYGVLRYNVVDLDLKLKHGVKHSTVAASFIAVFFIVSEGAKEFFAAQAGLGPWLGILAAGMLVFFIAPLQRVGEAVSSKVVPIQDDQEYVTYRRFQIYRVALEGALRDGIMHPSEQNALRNLRQELGVSMADHKRLEVEVRQRLGVEDERLEGG